ncbi:hypothetical protein TELCIR_13264, partial [Teladorsagia circumcincta]
VTAVDTTRRNVTLSTGEQLPYSKLVLALGGKPKKLPIPGADLKTSVDWVYAIGDTVAAPLPLWDIDSINIQHFQLAQTHG